MMACVTTGWFDTHRSLAVSLVRPGVGMAPIIMSPLAAWLVSNHDWRSLDAGRGRGQRRHHNSGFFALGAASAGAPMGGRRRRIATTRRHRKMSRAQALRSPRFIILLATNFLCCATHWGPVIHTVSYAVTVQIPMMAAVTNYSVEGLAGMGGRIAFGLLGDRFSG